MYHDVHIAANVIRECDPPVVIVILREVTDLVQMQRRDRAPQRGARRSSTRSTRIIARARSQEDDHQADAEAPRRFRRSEVRAGFYLLDHAKKDCGAHRFGRSPPAPRRSASRHIPLVTDMAFERIAMSQRTFVMEEDMPGHDGGNARHSERLGIKRTIGTVFRTGANKGLYGDLRSAGGEVGGSRGPRLLRYGGEAVRNRDREGRAARYAREAREGAQRA